MDEIASRELRSDTRGALRRVEAGEEVVITVSGRAVAVLRPLPDRRRWMPRTRLTALLAAHEADPGLADDLRTLAPDTTDDLQP